MMDIRNLPKILILSCAVIYVTAGTNQEEKSLKTSIVGRDGNPGGAKDDDNVVTSPKDGNYKLSYADYEMTWKKYKREHNKKYPSIREEKRRFAIFMEKVKAIEAHNMKYHLGQSTYWMDINNFSDWTQEEFEKWLGPQDIHTRSKRQAEGQVYYATEGEKLPESIDWRQKGFVTQVKDQTGSVEGQWFRKTGKLINLSEQQIVDCSTAFGNNQCTNGHMINSFQYIISAGGLQNETTYPYKAKAESCKFNKSLVVTQIHGYYIVDQNEAGLKSAVGTQGPVSVGISASTAFMNYAGGIFYEENCTGPGHALLVVGYGNSDGNDYWIVKNCWGSTWGNNRKGDGYIKMARNKGGFGTCGIASGASFPVVSDSSTPSSVGPKGFSTSSPHRSHKHGNNAIKLENNAITVLVTSTLVFLKFTQPCF